MAMSISRGSHLALGSMGSASQLQLLQKKLIALQKQLLKIKQEPLTAESMLQQKLILQEILAVQAQIAQIELNEAQKRANLHRQASA